jgi:hypothetical protein
MKVVFATANTQTFYSGRPISIVIGQHWPVDDPIVKAFPSMFSDDPRYGLQFTEQPAEERTAEQATAAPGEKRSTKRPTT